MNRPRGVKVEPFPSDRRLVTAAVRAGKRMAPMHGLAEVDVTEAQQFLASEGSHLSFTAFILATIARVAARHPEVHAYRTWSGRLATHRHVDVSTMVEIETSQGLFPLAHVVRDADIRTVADLTDELRGVKASPSMSGSGRLLERLGPLAGRIPGAFETMCLLIARSPSIRQKTGTVAVTSVGMFTGGAGLAIAPMALMSLQVVVGGISRKPRALGERIEARDVLDLTISIDHNVVDGAPAARFGADLREAIEHATALGAERGEPLR